MPQEDQASDPVGLQRRFLIDELQALMDALRELSLRIGAHRVRQRISASRLSAPVGERVRIRESLEPHLEATAATVGARRDPPRGASEGEGTVVAPLDAEAHPAEPVPGAGIGRFFREVAVSLRRRRGIADFQPHLGEKMQATTIRHINRALSLAKQGNAAGAKVYAGLAESAMETAGRYMAAEEYRAFREEVESRLSSLVQRG
jgi:hypothetical protein